MTASNSSSLRMNNIHIIYIYLFLRLYCQVEVVNSENIDEMHQQQTKTFDHIIEKHFPISNIEVRIGMEFSKAISKTFVIKFIVARLD